MIEVNKDNFEEEVVNAGMPVLVDMWGPSCVPCKALMPHVEELSKSYEGKVKFTKLDVSKNRRLCITLKVMGVPTFLFYKDGAEVARITGDTVTIEAIKENVDKIA